MTHKVFQGQTEQQIREDYEFVLLFARRKLGHFSQHHLSVVVSPEDVVQEAYAKLLKGDRSWSPEQGYELRHHLAGCVKSIISNYYTSKESRLLREMGESLHFVAATKDIKPEEAMDVNVMQVHYRNQVVNNKPEYLGVYDQMVSEDIQKPAELAKQLQQPVSFINTAKLALKRLLSKSR